MVLSHLVGEVAFPGAKRTVDKTAGITLQDPAQEGGLLEQEDSRSKRLQDFIESTCHQNPEVPVDYPKMQKMQRS